MSWPHKLQVALLQTAAEVYGLDVSLLKVGQDTQVLSAQTQELQAPLEGTLQVWLTARRSSPVSSASEFLELILFVLVSGGRHALRGRRGFRGIELLPKAAEKLSSSGSCIHISAHLPVHGGAL